MKYKLDKLVVDYIDNMIDIGAYEYRLKQAKLNNENEDDLINELKIVEEKVNITNTLFNKVPVFNLEVAPIEKWICESEYKVIKSIYIDRTGESLVSLKRRYSMANPCKCKKGGLKKLSQIEIEI